MAIYRVKKGLSKPRNIREKFKIALDKLCFLWYNTYRVKEEP